MALDTGFRNFVQDRFSGLGPVSVGPMFGDAGVHVDGVMFALIAFDTLYFKADEATVSDFGAENCGPFVHGKGKTVRMSCWQVSERLFEDPDEMLAWSWKALDATRRSRSTKSRPRQNKKAGS